MPTKIHRIQLTGAETASARSLVDEMARRYRSVEDPEFQRLAEVYAHELPRALRAGLVDFRLCEPAGLCVVSGWQVDDQRIGPTPAHWSDRPVPSPTLADDLFFYLCATFLGEPFAWATTQHGRVLQDVLPVQGEENRQLGTSSAEPLTWHIEDSFHPLRGDYVGLLCLRNPDMVETTCAAVADVNLPDKWLEALRAAQFVIRPDESHSWKTLIASAREHRVDLELLDRALEHYEAIVERPDQVPVLFGDPDDPYLLINSFYMDEPESEPARAALAGITAGLEAAMSGVALAQGDLLFLDNYKVVHGRASFTARFDGTDRWLRRLNVTRDLRRSRELRVSASSRIVF